MGDLIVFDTAVGTRSGARGSGPSAADRAGRARSRTGSRARVRETVRGKRAVGSPVRGGGRSAVPLRQPVAAAGAPESGVAVAAWTTAPSVRTWANDGALALAEHWPGRPAFFFDLACPFSYVAAERVERLLGDVEWLPTPLLGEAASADPDALLAQAASLARGARLPLVCPERFPAAVPRAMRAADYAAEVGAGARFALAASRLAFCGGFDLEKRSVLADVAAAAGLPVADCLAAAGEEWRDEQLQASAQALHDQGISRLPVVAVDHRWFDGAGAVTEAAAWLKRD